MTTSSMLLEQTGEETKTMLCEKERNTPDQCKKQGGQEREGKRKGTLRIEFGQGRQQKRKKKNQDKFYGQESIYSLITAVSNVIDSNMLKTKSHLSFPSQMMEK